MVEMQQAHNVHVHPSWHLQAYPFHRAIWIECAELIDHYGWKWWKHQNRDLDQVRLELVDIWHFGLSSLMVEHKEHTSTWLLAFLKNLDGKPRNQADFIESIEQLASFALNKVFSVESFFSAMNSLSMSFETLFVQYVNKNTLNLFRQANGYKEGTYQKIWYGREDNEYLVELAATLEPAHASYVEELQQLLGSVYERMIESRN